MDFSSILSIFDLHEFLKVENYLLGQVGYLFSLDRGVAYIYEETKGDNYAEIYINGEFQELTQVELKKLHSLIRLQRRKPRKISTKDLWIYSRHIERMMLELLDKRPDLEKSSTHMAFAPKNYTRFSENLLFDFNYFYNDQDIIHILSNFDDIFENEIKGSLSTKYQSIKESLPADASDELSSSKWGDGQLYRYLLDYIQKNRFSINGKISTPQFLRDIYSLSLDHSEDNLYFHFGPYLLCLSSTFESPILMPRKQNVNISNLKENYYIIQPDADLVKSVLSIDL